MNAEDQVRPFMPVYCDQDELLRCEHGFPVELAPCPKCAEPHGQIVGYAATDSIPYAGGHLVTVAWPPIKPAPVTGWPCPGCGADNNHFEFCRNCHRPQP